MNVVGTSVPQVFPYDFNYFSFFKHMQFNFHRDSPSVLNSSIHSADDSNMLFLIVQVENGDHPSTHF